jgi:hypothetical protein
MAILAIAAIYFLSERKARQNLDRTLAKWKESYSLTEEQVEKIRTLEKQYHGTSVFFNPSHTLQDETDHRIAISKQMSAEAAARFLSPNINNTHLHKNTKH